MSSNLKSERILLDLNVSAPSFELKDIFGKTVELKNYKGRKVLIAFFRHAGCPYCNLRVHFLQKKQEELKSKNLEMIFFFESNEKVLLSSGFHKDISPIPVIADPEKIWYSIYGIENSSLKSTISHLTSFIQTAVKAKINSLPVHLMAGGESINTMPAEFLLDENSIIRKICYSNGLNDRMSIEHIFAFADADRKSQQVN